MNAKIVCIWGSPASGKTICALAIASKLASKKKNVIVFNGDRLTPSLKIYVPTKALTSEQSVGSFLMLNEYEDTKESLLASKLIVHPKSEYICFLGMSPNENYMTYHNFTKNSIIKLLNKISNLADYIIIDGLSNPFEDFMTLFGLECAQYVIRTITPDSKGVMYNNANQGIFKGDKFRFDDHIKVIGNVKKISPINEVISAIGGGKNIITLPYSEEVESKFIAGELISNMNRRKGIKFEKEISKLVRLFEDDINIKDKKS
ncbi:MAG: hypothetical protein LUG94_07655 [Ruminococcus sp.]|nr:hypothetical protein [Ruminococcus sp.]